MSRGALISKIQNELERLNTQIDLKIINGEAYRFEARRHKSLLSQLSRLTGREGWLDRSFRFLTLF